jgi:ribosomal protein S19E (S16A)
MEKRDKNYGGLKQRSKAFAKYIFLSNGSFRKILKALESY